MDPSECSIHHDATVSAVPGRFQERKTAGSARQEDARVTRVLFSNVDMYSSYRVASRSSTHRPLLFFRQLQHTTRLREKSRFRFMKGVGEKTTLAKLGLVWGCMVRQGREIDISNG